MIRSSIGSWGLNSVEGEIIAGCSTFKQLGGQNFFFLNSIGVIVGLRAYSVSTFFSYVLLVDVTSPWWNLLRVDLASEGGEMISDLFICWNCFKLWVSPFKVPSFLFFKKSNLWNLAKSLEALKSFRFFSSFTVFKVDPSTYLPILWNIFKFYCRLAPLWKVSSPTDSLLLRVGSPWKEREED